MTDPGGNETAKDPDEAPSAEVIPLAEAVEAIDVGLAIVDAERRIILMNTAFRESLELPADAVPAGTAVVDAVRAAALRGVYGPGDPDAQVAAVMAADRSRPGRLRRRKYGGRSFDLYNAPLSGGGYAVTSIDVTALVAARADAERAVSEATAALATLRTGLAAFSAEGRLLFWNLRFAELLSIPPTRIMNGLLFPAVLDVMAEAEEYAGADGQFFLLAQRGLNRVLPDAARRQCASGTVIDVVSAPLPGGGWTITVTDITRLVQAEDEARRRALLLESILANVPHGICVYGPDHRVAMFNPTYTQVMRGAPLAVGEHISEIIRRRADAREYGTGEPDRVYQREAGHDLSRLQMRRRIRPDGTAIDIRTAPLPDGGHISVVTDITAQVEAEREVSRRAEQMTAMLASIRHGIVLWDAEGRLVATNAITAELLGQPAGLLAEGRPETEILESLRRSGAFAETEDVDVLISALIGRDRTARFTRGFMMRSGHALEMQSDPAPNGGFVTTYTDVTDARMAEETLRRGRDAAEAANLAKSRFLATMSHELRTPLNSVIGFSDTLLREAAHPEPDRIDEFAREINEAGRHLLSLINVILDVARIEAGRFELADDPIDIGRLIRSAVRQVETAARAGEITVLYDLPAAMPGLRADERRLSQALQQVLSNAVKFTEVGGTVTIGAGVEADGSLFICVRDTGIGISPLDLDRVFEPFTQLDSTLSRRYGGTGLGLFIARAMVAGHGGTLTLTSQPGDGTTAWIRLPADRVRS